MKMHVQPFCVWLAVLWHCIILPVQYGNAQAVTTTKAESQSKAEDDGGSKDCCAFSLQFVNQYESPYIKKIRVSAMCDTKICCADPDEWGQTGSTPDFVEWFPIDSTGAPVGVPFGNAIDNEFLIYLSAETDPYYLQVEWFDFNDNVVCRHTIEVSCKGEYKEDEDWTQYTSKTPLNDDRLFVFAVREIEEDEEGCEDFLKDYDCWYDHSITCSGIDDYLVSFDGPEGYELYEWAVVSGPSYPSITSEQHTAVILSAPGVYMISMNATHLDTGESCSTEQEVIIPGFDPTFSTTRVPLPCSATFRFTPSGAWDASTVTGVNWSCVGIPGFPSYCSYGGYVDYTFTTPGNYLVTMTLMDSYGCAHSDTQTVVVSFDCHAQAEVDKYYLCSDCQGEANVQVFFNNTSTGGTCPLTFTWNFGDGTPVLTTNETQLSVPHTYAVANCAMATNYSVTITMTDSDSDPCTDTFVFPVTIAPCRPDVTWRVCPDGKINLHSTVPGNWTFTPTLEVVSGSLTMSDHVVVRACSTGTYGVSFEGFCGYGGRCIITRSVVVNELFCCAKNDADRDRHEFSVGGKDYRMKYKMVQRNLLFYHKIRLKTKLKKHKTLFGIGYWKGTKADQIEAHCDGTIYKSDPECNCVLPFTVDDGVVKYNKTKAKKNISIGERYRSRLNSLISTHRVIKDGYDVTKYLDLGNDCDESCN